MSPEPGTDLCCCLPAVSAAAQHPAPSPAVGGLDCAQLSRIIALVLASPPGAAARPVELRQAPR